MDDDRPMSIFVGKETRGNVCLTHSLWCPVSEIGRSEQPETGVHRIDIPRGEHGHFELMQHGCCDWSFVTDLTFQALAKGWDTERISDFIRAFGERRRQTRRRAA